MYGHWNAEKLFPSNLIFSEKINTYFARKLIHSYLSEIEFFLIATISLLFTFIIFQKNAISGAQELKNIFLLFFQDIQKMTNNSLKFQKIGPVLKKSRFWSFWHRSDPSHTFEFCTPPLLFFNTKIFYALILISRLLTVAWPIESPY